MAALKRKPDPLPLRLENPEPREVLQLTPHYGLAEHLGCIFAQFQDVRIKLHRCVGVKDWPDSLIDAQESQASLF